MEARKWMTHPARCVKPRDSIQHARDLMQRLRVNQLPVEVDGRLVGIITDRDLRDASPSVFDLATFEAKKSRTDRMDPTKVPVEDVMTANVTTIGPADSIAEAASLMRKERIGALPVVDGERLTGILTRTDVLGAFVELASAK